MKTLFIQAKFKKDVDINKIDGLNSLCLDPIVSTEAADSFDLSQFQMLSALNLCDVFHFGEIEKQDIFCIYHKLSVGEQTARETIKEIIVDGDFKNVVNYEDLLIDVAVKQINHSDIELYEMYCDCTIFWDVNNNMIIVAGKENCLKMAYALEAEAYRSFGKYAPVHNFVNDQHIHPFTKKIKAYNQND